jgi:hypothetical protein
MAFAENYFTNYSFLKPQIKEPPSGLLLFIVVIPVYHEDGFIAILESLYESKKPDGEV